MKNLAIFSIIFNLIFSVVLVILFVTNFGFNIRNLKGLTDNQNVESIDTTIKKTEPKTLDFEVNKPKIVYVPQKVIERYFTEKQPINNYYENYYKDSTTIIMNGDKPVEAVATLDTIINDDGEFRISALSPTPLYGLNLDYTLNQMEITKTILPKHQLFVGGNIGGNSNRFQFGTEVQYQLNGQHGFKYEYDWVNGVHSIGYLKRINFNKLKK